MKYNQLHKSKRLAASGFTLIEISLVIALLLGLIAVVFLGLGSYRAGSNQAQCRMQLASVQKAVRSYANLNNLVIGAACVDTLLTDGTIMSAKPLCPAGGTYSYLGLVPAIGVPYADCDEVGPPDHRLVDATTTPAIADW